MFQRPGSRGASETTGPATLYPRAEPGSRGGCNTHCCFGMLAPGFSTREIWSQVYEDPPSSADAHKEGQQHTQDHDFAGPSRTTSARRAAAACVNTSENCPSRTQVHHHVDGAGRWPRAPRGVPSAWLSVRPGVLRLGFWRPSSAPSQLLGGLRLRTSNCRAHPRTPSLPSRL